jgi:glycogen synthase
LKKNNPGIKAIIAGDGPEKTRLSGLIDQHGLQENITLAGKLQRPEVLELMGRCRVLLHPSEIEGFGMVCAEALNMGMLVVSRRVGSVLEHQDWRFANTLEEFTAQTTASLDDIQPTSKEVFFDIRQCVKEYVELFERLAVK